MTSHVRAEERSAMTETTASVSPAPERVPNGKWVSGISGGQELGQVAEAVLDARLRAVWHWLVLSAERSDDDLEYVHQLRIACRRATQAVRLVGELLPDEAASPLCATLRRIRVAADAARNWDVMCQRFLCCEADSGGGLATQFLGRAQACRRQAQSAIVDVYRELLAASFESQIEYSLALVRDRRDGARLKFTRRAKQYLKRVVQRFFQAGECELSSDEALHELRIRTKKLRYTMELVAGAFGPRFRRKLYPLVGQVQDRLGAVNDHALACRLLREWLAMIQDPELLAFLEGMLLAEANARHDLREVFLQEWTPRRRAKLRRRFRACCGVR
jgi:CHAD domain-containing protein